MPRDVVLRTDRRRLLQGMGVVSLSLAGASLLAGCANQVAPSFSSSTAGQLETTRIRLPQFPSLCVAPQYVAEDLLRAEGFTDVHYVRSAGGLGGYQTLAAGGTGIRSRFVGAAVNPTETGPPPRP